MRVAVGTGEVADGRADPLDGLGRVNVAEAPQQAGLGEPDVAGPAAEQAVEDAHARVSGGGGFEGTRRRAGGGDRGWNGGGAAGGRYYRYKCRKLGRRACLSTSWSSPCQTAPGSGPAPARRSI